MKTRPYPGLRPFTRQEQSVFFGRESQVAYLVKKLRRMRFVSVVGVSGCGKSSLVRAGLIPELERRADDTGTCWQSIIMRPGPSPFQSLADALLQHTPLEQVLPASIDGQTDEDRRAFVLESLCGGALGLVEMMRRATLPKNTHLLLVVDQFEELFRASTPDGQDDASAFVALLLASVRQKEIPISVVLTMRADVIGECARFQGLPQRMNAGQYLVPHLTSKQQREAICKPAEVCGGKVEPELVRRLLHELQDGLNQLPVLQHCLMRMWDMAASQAADETDAVSLTVAHYEAVGGLSHALSGHADEAYLELDAAGQRIAEAIFRCLSERGIDRQDSRRPTPLRDIAAVAGVSVPDVQAVAEVFRRPDRSFLTPAIGTPLQPGTILDISHESLIRRWDRMNAWADEETKSAHIYQRLEQTARLWTAGEAALWTTPDLEHALAWKDQEHPTPAWARRYSILPIPESPQTDREPMRTERPPDPESGQVSQEKKSLSTLLRQIQNDAVRPAKSPPDSPQREHDGFQLAMKFLTASKEAQEAQRLQEERERQQALRRARRQLAFVSLGFVIVLAVALWGGWERWRREQALEEKEMALAARQQVLTEKEEFIDFVSSQLGTTHTNFDNGVNNAQAALSVLNDQYLPNWEHLLTSEIDVLSAEIETIQTENQREALCGEKLWLEGDTSVYSKPLTTYDMSEDVANLQATYELFNEFYALLDQEVTLIQEENKRRFLAFYKEFRQILEGVMHREPLEPESLLGIIGEELYKYLVLLNPDSASVDDRNLDRKSTIFFNTSRVKTSQDSIQSSIDPDISLDVFKRGRIPQHLINEIDALEWNPQQFEQRTLAYIETIYKEGHQAEVEYVDGLLRKKEQELEVISNEISALRNELSTARMNKQSALASLRQHLDSAFHSYHEAARTFEDMQGVVDAMVADAAFRDGLYEKAIRFALRALAASPDTLSSYETLILALPRLSSQITLSHDFLDEIFHELVRFSDRLAAEGRINTLANEHKTYLSQIYFECSRCYAAVQDIEKAAVALDRAITIAELVEQNETNIARLQRWQETLNKQVK